jgi:hypothetical protein
LDASDFVPINVIWTTPDKSARRAAKIKGVKNTKGREWKFTAHII